MKTILVLGGYGTFGRRIATRLAEAGFSVVVAGRSEAKAAAFCMGRERLSALALDRDHGLAERLATLRPFAVVDAAGPFQGADHSVARAAIAAGCHYLDIADGRDFVLGIAKLDGPARAAGVAAISGASSLPALSQAAAMRLAEGLDRVRAVEIALSASSRGTAGRSVTQAILSYLGRPVRLWRGGRWTAGRGWQELRRATFRIAGRAPLSGRLVALADVPDLDLLPARLAGGPAVTFHAGTDVALHNLGLWMLSWPIRWRWVRGLTGMAGFLSRVQRWTGWAGSPRSAMEVRLFGTVGPHRLERRWTLLVERREGPEVPSLPVPLLAAKLAAGSLEAGARDAGGLLDLEDFAEPLGRLAAAQEIVELDLPPPLYARVMGAAFDKLPPAVRAMHDVLRDGGASGAATVERGRNPLASAAAALFGFPAEGEHPLHLSFREREGRELWRRDFSGRCFSSHLSEHGGLLAERFGPLRFGFDLPADASGLEMVLRRWWLGFIPLPMALAPRAQAREWEEGGRFRFDVRVSLPLVGLLVRYRGWLEPAGSPIPGRPRRNGAIIPPAS